MTIVFQRIIGAMKFGKLLIDNIRMKKVVVLGVTGMLGSMVYDFLSKKGGYELMGTARDVKNTFFEKDKNILVFDASQDDPATLLKKCKPDYVINCIGIIKPYCKDGDEAGMLRAIEINARFPHLLSDICKKNDCRVIQIATDCVYSGQKGGYVESDLHDALDAYGKSKSLGEVILPNFLNIRSSIIGPEIRNKLSLLEWFFSRKNGEVLSGFTHHKWNGINTLQFAEICEMIITLGEDAFDQMAKQSPVFHLVLNKTVDKYQLLNIFSRVFEKEVEIKMVDNIGQPVDRSISSKYDHFKKGTLLEMEVAISRLKHYVESSDVFQYSQKQ